MVDAQPIPNTMRDLIVAYEETRERQARLYEEIKRRYRRAKLRCPNCRRKSPLGTWLCFCVKRGVRDHGKEWLSNSEVYAESSITCPECKRHVHLDAHRYRMLVYHALHHIPPEQLFIVE